MEIKQAVLEIAKKAKSVAPDLAVLSTADKNKALNIMAKMMADRRDYFIQENRKDLEYAREKGLSAAMIDRLTLDDKRIAGMVKSIQDIIHLKDPVGSIIDQWKLPNGLSVGKIRVPLGVIGIIYESRPNVTSEAATLCFKAGNAVILRGGSESIHSNLAIAGLLKDALKEASLPQDLIGFINITEREAVTELLKLNQYIDVIIPRGGEGLIRTVAENSTIPVIKHYKGVCNLYIHKDADKNMAVNIAVNSKVQRPGVCNAIENLIFHKDFPYIKEVITALQEKNVEIRGDSNLANIAEKVAPVKEEDYYEEFLDLILAVKIVDSYNKAVRFIRKYGSGHSDAIVTEGYSTAEKFLQDIDSSTVYVNASTRFTDGGQFMMGAEIGISTDKLHARGPMALDELTTYKFIIRGSGQIRE